MFEPRSGLVPQFEIEKAILDMQYCLPFLGKRNYKLPFADGLAGQVPATDGDGTISWVNVSALASDGKVYISANDSVSGFLNGKLIGTSNKITLTENNDGIDETLQVNIGSDVVIGGDNISRLTNDTGFIVQDDIDWATNVPANETDPIFSAWLLATPPLYSETDPVFNAWLGTPPDLSEFNNDQGFISDLTNFDTDDLVEGDTNKYFPGFSNLADDYGFTDNSTNWNTAYGWGDHAEAGYFVKATDDSDDINEGATNLFDKTVALSGDSDISVSGTYPNFSLSFANGSGFLTSATAPWTSIVFNLEYHSADDPTYQMKTTTDVDLTDTIGVGMKIKLTNDGSTKYFFITGIDYNSTVANRTVITMYGGTDYDLVNSAITNPYYSTHRAPFGFPLQDEKWTYVITDTTFRSQGSPVQNRWYNWLSANIPIGSWSELRYKAMVGVDRSLSTGVTTIYTTLSTANNSESDPDFTMASGSGTSTSDSDFCVATHRQGKIISLTSKTTYYLNLKTSSASASNLYSYNNSVAAAISCKCAYL